MEKSLLFRNRSPLSEFPFVTGGEEHRYRAQRNTKSVAKASAVFVRALKHLVEDNFRLYYEKENHKTFLLHTAGKKVWVNGLQWFIPYANNNNIPYYYGCAVFCEALLLGYEPVITSYINYLEAWQNHGLDVAVKPYLLEAADELYYFAMYASRSAEKASYRLGDKHVIDAETFTPLQKEIFKQRFTDFTDGEKLMAFINKSVSIPTVGKGFIGWQKDVLWSALYRAENVLLMGGTGSGKSSLVYEMSEKLSGILENRDDKFSMVLIEGREGLEDIDLFGAIMPHEEGDRWVDGPLVQALRLASQENHYVLLFIDEINRMRSHHINFLLGLMNPKSGSMLNRMGIEADDEQSYYEVMLPMTSERVYCLSQRLWIVAAGNFGRNNIVHRLGPAIMRRFTTHIPFRYLPLEHEKALLMSRTSIEEMIADALLAVATYSRHQQQESLLPGCIDTASLLAWSSKVAENGARTVADILELGYMTWGNLCCGTDSMGFVEPENFLRLTEHLKHTGLIPQGDLTQMKDRLGLL